MRLQRVCTVALSLVSASHGYRDSRIQHNVEFSNIHDPHHVKAARVAFRGVIDSTGKNSSSFSLSSSSANGSSPQHGWSDSTLASSQNHTRTRPRYATGADTATRPTSHSGFRKTRSLTTSDDATGKNSHYSSSTFNWSTTLEIPSTRLSPTAPVSVAASADHSDQRHASSNTSRSTRSPSSRSSTEAHLTGGSLTSTRSEHVGSLSRTRSSDSNSNANSLSSKTGKSTTKSSSGSSTMSKAGLLGSSGGFPGDVIGDVGSLVGTPTLTLGGGVGGTVSNVGGDLGSLLPTSGTSATEHDDGHESSGTRPTPAAQSTITVAPPIKQPQSHGGNIGSASVSQSSNGIFGDVGGGLGSIVIDGSSIFGGAASAVGSGPGGVASDIGNGVGGALGMNHSRSLSSSGSKATTTRASTYTTSSHKGSGAIGDIAGGLTSLLGGQSTASLTASGALETGSISSLSGDDVGIWGGWNGTIGGAAGTAATSAKMTTQSAAASASDIFTLTSILSGGASATVKGSTSFTASDSPEPQSTSIAPTFGPDVAPPESNSGLSTAQSTGSGGHRSSISASPMPTSGANFTTLSPGPDATQSSVFTLLTSSSETFSSATKSTSQTPYWYAHTCSLMVPADGGVRSSATSTSTASETVATQNAISWPSAILPSADNPVQPPDTAPVSVLLKSTMKWTWMIQSPDTTAQVLAFMPGLFANAVGNGSNSDTTLVRLQSYSGEDVTAADSRHRRSVPTSGTTTDADARTLYVAYYPRGSIDALQAAISNSTSAFYTSNASNPAARELASNVDSSWNISSSVVLASIGTAASTADRHESTKHTTLRNILIGVASAAVASLAAFLAYRFWLSKKKAKAALRHASLRDLTIRSFGNSSLRETWFASSDEQHSALHGQRLAEAWGHNDQPNMNERHVATRPMLYRDNSTSSDRLSPFGSPLVDVNAIRINRASRGTERGAYAQSVYSMDSANTTLTEAERIRQAYMARTRRASGMQTSGAVSYDSDSQSISPSVSDFHSTESASPPRSPMNTGPGRASRSPSRTRSPNHFGIGGPYRPRPSTNAPNGRKFSRRPGSISSRISNPEMQNNSLLL